MTEENLDVTIELLDANGDIVRLIARAATIPIARGSYDAGVKEYGARYGVRMRQRSRVIERYEKTV